MTSKMKFTGSIEMRQTAIICIMQMLKYETGRRVKALMNATTSTGIDHALRDIDNNIWRDFLYKADQEGQVFRRDPGVPLTGTVKDGYRIVVPYNPKVPKALFLDLTKGMTVLEIKVELDEELRIFGRVLYKLGGNPKVLKMPVEINGEVLNLGHWLSAFICKMMDDPAGYAMYHDEGVDNATDSR